MKVKELIELLEADGWYQVKPSPISSSDKEGNRNGCWKAKY